MVFWHVIDILKHHQINIIKELVVITIKMTKDIQVNWLIEDGPFAEDIGPILSAINSQGMNYNLVKYIPFQSGQYNLYNKKDCVICYGSINLIRQLQKEYSWVPGSWCNFKNFECSTYYSYFGKHLLNDDYIMLPFNEIGRRKELLYNYFGDPIFIRPNSGVKTFTGHLLDKKYFDKDFAHMLSFVSPESLTIISSAKNIEKEWRFIACDKKIISGCQYMEKGELNILTNYDEYAKLAADKVASEVWEPDSIYVIDICLERYIGYKLLEINSFSCSGWYLNDPNIIVAEAKRKAIEEYTDFYG